MKASRLINIFLVVFVDMLGFGLILPLLPYYAETFGASPVVIGLLVASFAAAWLIGAALDRLTHHAHTLIIRGDSFRQRTRRKEFASINSISEDPLKPES